MLTNGGILWCYRQHKKSTEQEVTDSAGTEPVLKHGLVSMSIWVKKKSFLFAEADRISADS